MKKADQMLLRVTFGVEREERRNASYSWDSDKRGEEPFVILQWTHQGKGVFEFRQKSHEVKVGQAFLSIVPEKARYAYPSSAREPWVFSWINLEGPLALGLSRALRESFGPVLDIPLQSPCAWVLTEMISKASHRAFQNSLEESELCYRFLLLCREQQMKKSGALKTSLREIADYYRQQNNEMVAVKEMAARAGLSREHFSRAFRKETGTGPAAYLRELRIARAAALLKRTDMPVSEIAGSCGFASARQFSKTFRHFRGISPGEHRQEKSH